MTKPEQIIFELPDWIENELARFPSHIPKRKNRMSMILHLARQNFERNTGGPFAAGVFELQSGKLISVGVNRVEVLNASSAHAEIIAISIAQKNLTTYDLGGNEKSAYELVINWMPCSMCYGAVLWSGVRSLAIAGSGCELEKITGFDEGPVHPSWQEELAVRGIEIHQNILKDEALLLFEDFSKSGGTVYNARKGHPQL